MEKQEDNKEGGNEVIKDIVKVSYHGGPLELNSRGNSVKMVQNHTSQLSSLGSKGTGIFTHKLQNIVYLGTALCTQECNRKLLPEKVLKHRDTDTGNQPQNRTPFAVAEQGFSIINACIFILMFRFSLGPTLNSQLT